MRTNCPDCGDTIRGNCHYEWDGDDEIQVCDTCGFELCRQEDKPSKMVDTARF